METYSLDTLRRYVRVTVMGLGLFGGGVGAARFFAGLGARVTVTDMASREKLARSVAALDGLDIRFVLGEHREADFIETDLVVTNQAVRPDNPFLEIARSRGIPVVTETGLALGLNPSPWAGVTGSSGKSTTASLFAEMVRHHDAGMLFGGNIGGDLLTRTAGRTSRAPLVAELSSFQLTYVGVDIAEGRVAPPRVAVVTNLAANHLDWHADMDEYVAAKMSLLRHQKADDWAILNADDALLLQATGSLPGRVVYCSLRDEGRGDACFVADDAVVVRFGRVERCWPLDAYRLPGRHNRYNAVQAVAAAFALTQDADAVARGLAAFFGLPHRLEAVGEAGGRRFVNDSKATTPEAAIIALEAMDNPVLIAGGYDKHAPFEALAKVIQKRAAALVLVGQAGARLRDAVAAVASSRSEGWTSLPITDAGDDFELAVRKAYALTPPGGVVLLSPACASFGMFVNYEERGRVFGELAARLSREANA